MSDANQPANAAEALLRRLKHNGVDYLFGNAGTDFAPVIEGYARTTGADKLMPEPLVIPHETAAIAMAHSYYLMTGRPQAAMVHVNVGLANALMGVINAASENIPLIMMAGRTPITEHDRLGARMTPIQYGQEMRDQSGMVRESVKWDYELRYPEQAANLADRAMAIAMSEPRGPVFLSLPREPLADAWPEGLPIDGPMQAIPSPPQADAGAVEEAAAALTGAKNPLIICQRSDPEGRTAAALSALADRYALPVVEFLVIRNVLPSSHPMQSGYDVGPYLDKADVILVVDSQVPWIQRNVQPAEGAKVIHIGADPLFSRMPVRSFRNDLAITGDPASTLVAIDQAMDGKAGDVSARYAEIKERNEARRAQMAERALSGNGSPMSPAFVSRCISDAMDEDAVSFHELGAPPPFFDFAGPNRYFNPPFSGGLGWGVPAALGASLANPDRLSIACVGDGSYMFANPVACHQVAEAMNLPILTIVLNNGIWNAVRRAALNVYPEGEAAKANTMPLTALDPSPDYCAIAGASRAWSEKVERGEDLPGALERAIHVIRTEKRQALLELQVAITN